MTRLDEIEQIINNMKMTHPQTGAIGWEYGEWLVGKLRECENLSIGLDARPGHVRFVNFSNLSGRANEREKGEKANGIRNYICTHSFCWCLGSSDRRIIV